MASSVFITFQGVPVSSLTGLGTGVATALAVNIGSDGAVVTFNGALGTPSSGTGTNITGIPEANILAGTILARLASANVFTENQTISKTNPQLNLLTAANTSYATFEIGDASTYGWQYGKDNAAGGQTGTNASFFWYSRNTSANAAFLTPAGTFRANKLAGLASAPAIAGDATLVVNSTDVQGKIVSTVTGVMTATLTFGTAYAVAPSGSATNETTANLTRAVSTTTTLVVTGTTVTGDVISYSVIGR